MTRPVDFDLCECGHYRSEHDGGAWGCAPRRIGPVCSCHAFRPLEHGPAHIHEVPHIPTAGGVASHTETPECVLALDCNLLRQPDAVSVNGVRYLPQAA